MDMEKNLGEIPASKLSWKYKIGYGFGTAADTVPYNLFFVYFMYYLTDVVGVAAGIAGTISLVVIIFDTAVNPIIGNLSDKYVTEKGRRMPWMKAAVIPLCIMVYVMFSPIEFGNTGGTFFFYVVVALGMWICYNFFYIPYCAMGAEITEDYKDRNFLRLTAMLNGYILFIAAASGPMWIWEWHMNKFMEDAYYTAMAVGDAATMAAIDAVEAAFEADAEDALDQWYYLLYEVLEYSDRPAWGIIGFALAIFILVFALISFTMLKGVEKESIRKAMEAKKEEILEQTKRSLVAIVSQILKLKQMRIVVGFTFVFVLGFIMAETLLVYVMDHNAGMSEGEQAVFWIFFAIAAAGTMPFMTLVANKYGKKVSCLLFASPAIIASFYFYFTGIDAVAHAYVYGLLWAIGGAPFYMYYIALAFDCVEVNEFITGDRNEGNIVGVICTVFKGGSAIGIFFAGMILEMFGYDGTAIEQTAEGLQGILTASALVPAVICTLALIFIMVTYKISVNKYNLMVDALEKKRAGEEYSTEGFEDILT